jgi:hypothetical protein
MNKQENKQVLLLGEIRNLHTRRLTTFYKNAKVKIQTYSATTQECLNKNCKCCQQITILHNETGYTNKKCLPMWLYEYLEITHSCLAAGDFVLKPKVLRHVPGTSFVNPCHVLRGYICSRRELHYSKNSNAVTFTSTCLGILLYFFENSFLKI